MNEISVIARLAQALLAVGITIGYGLFFQSVLIA